MTDKSHASISSLSSANALAEGNAHNVLHINITITVTRYRIVLTVKIRSEVISSAGWIRQPFLTAMDVALGPLP
jgi:hypothetical protein